MLRIIPDTIWYINVHWKADKMARLIQSTAQKRTDKEN